MSRTSQASDVSIPYHPSWRKHPKLGTTSAALLLAQMLYWHNKVKGRPFYKFKAPCGNEHYKSGDSWIEELGFGKDELDAAMDKICQRVSRSGIEKDPEALVWRFTDISRLTWFEVNVSAVDSFLEEVFANRELTVSQNGHLPLPQTGKSYLDTLLFQETTLQETTSVQDTSPTGDGGAYSAPLSRRLHVVEDEASRLADKHQALCVRLTARGMVITRPRTPASMASSIRSIPEHARKVLDVALDWAIEDRYWQKELMKHSGWVSKSGNRYIELVNQYLANKAPVPRSIPDEQYYSQPPRQTAAEAAEEREAEAERTRQVAQRAERFNLASRSVGVQINGETGTHWIAADGRLFEKSTGRDVTPRRTGIAPPLPPAMAGA